MSSNPYEPVYKLIREGKADEALHLMMSPSREGFVSPYNEDLNHTWYIVGDIYFKEKEFEKAIQAFSKSIADRPDDHEAMLALANCYSETGDAAKSEQVLREALTYDDNPALIYNLACALFDQEKYSEAIIFFRRVPPSDSITFELAQKNLKMAESRLE